MRRGWLRRNRLTTILPHTIRLCGRVAASTFSAPSSSVRCLEHSQSQTTSHFFGEVSRAEALGLKTRRPPGRFCRAPRILGFFVPLPARIQVVPTRASILSCSYTLHHQLLSLRPKRNTGKSARKYSGNIGGTNRDPLQSLYEILVQRVFCHKPAKADDVRYHMIYEPLFRELRLNLADRRFGRRTDLELCTLGPGPRTGPQPAPPAVATRPKFHGPVRWIVLHLASNARRN